MEATCPICSLNTDRISDYRYNINLDIKYLKILNIHYCQKCDFSFVSPMPTKKNLDNYYNNIYRSKGRPHYINIKKFHKTLYSPKNLGYLEYIDTFLDINKLENILDFGAGTGDLGLLLKKINPSIKLYCVENDKKTISILEKRGFENLKSLDNQSVKFDLIISLHCFEHLNSLKIFEKFKLIGKNQCKIFFEVPNCPFNDGFINRPYDSPHLLFFTKNSLLKIFKGFKLKVINLTLKDIDYNANFLEMKSSKELNENWQEKNKRNFSIKEILLFLTPKIIRNVYDAVMFSNNLKIQTTLRYKAFELNKRSCIRGIIEI